MKNWQMVMLAGVLTIGSGAKAAAPSCKEAFADQPKNSVLASLEYTRQIYGTGTFTDADLKMMADASQRTGLKPDVLFARAEEFAKLADSKMALTLNNREMIRAAAIAGSVQNGMEVFEKHFGTLIVMVEPRVPQGTTTRRLAVPNRIQARLAELALLTGENGGDVAFRFNDNFKIALKKQPQTIEEMAFAKPPLETALELTIAESHFGEPSAAKENLISLLTEN